MVSQWFPSRVARGFERGYEGCAGRVPRGFRRGFRRVSEGVSEGFPWVSGGFREKVNIKRITEIIVFAKPWSRGLGFPSASECPYYNIRRTKLTMRTGRGEGPIGGVRF